MEAVRKKYTSYKKTLKERLIEAKSEGDLDRVKRLNKLIKVVDKKLVPK
ncbi:hypothetical protein [Halonatronum saccharophilum]|nr:hypothetical protein [Halonatronum saccharophilum]